MNRIQVFYLFLVVILLQSCIASKNNLYFEDLEPGRESILREQLLETQKIQPFDILMVNIGGKDEMLMREYQPPGMGAGGGNMQATGGRGIGYNVSKEGYIDLPSIGRIQAAGFTTYQLAEIIQREVAKDIIDPFVSVKQINYRVNVLGAVGSPGPIMPMTDRVSIFDAIAQSGDLTPTSNKKRVWVIRETENGNHYELLNLNSKDIFKSEYYYLKNNDIVYAEPGKFASFVGINAPVFGTIGAFSGVLGLVLTLINLRNL